MSTQPEPAARCGALGARLNIDVMVTHCILFHRQPSQLSALPPGPRGTREQITRLAVRNYLSFNFEILWRRASDQAANVDTHGPVATRLHNIGLDRMVAFH